MNPSVGTYIVCTSNWYMGNGYSISYTGVESVSCVGTQVKNDTEFSGYVFPLTTISNSTDWKVLFGACWYPNMMAVSAYTAYTRRSGTFYSGYYSSILADSNGGVMTIGSNMSYLVCSTLARCITGIAITLKSK